MSLHYWPWIALGLVILLSVMVRWRLREMPLERDEGEYAYAGQLILEGIPPYKLAYNMKLPGTYTAYAMMMAAFGQTTSGIHVGLILVNAAAIILVFLLGRKLLDEIAGAVAAVAYALMSLSPSVLGLQAHATHFVVVPALGGALILLNAAHNRQVWPLLASGGLFGLAFVMKQHGALFGVFGLIYLIWATTRVEVKSRNRNHHHRAKTPGFQFDLRKCGRAWGVFGLGLAVPYLLTCAVLWSAGVSGQFFFWTISYANKYVTAVPLGNAAEEIRAAISIVTSPNLFFWLLAMLGAVVMWWETRIERERFFVTVFFICSLVSISLGFYFRGHYFILLLPALSLLAGIAVSRGIYVMKNDRTLELIPAAVSLVLFIVGLGSETLTNSAYWFEFSPVKACQQIYGSSLFSEAVRIADFVRSNTPPQATILVMGSEPEIYFYSQRHSATGFIYMYSLMESHEYVLKMQEDMIREVETSNPEYVVFVKLNESWLQRRYSHQRLFEWWEGCRAQKFDLVQTVDIKAERLANEELNLAASDLMKNNRNDQNSTATKLPSEKIGQIMIFKRKAP